MRQNRNTMRPARRSAFTLMEVLAAAIILTVALAVITSSMGNSFSHFRAARLAQVAQRIATEKLQLAAVNVQPFPAGGTETQLATNFDWQLRLITPSVSNVAATTKLACDVNWTFRNDPKTLTLERVITPLSPTGQTPQEAGQ